MSARAKLVRYLPIVIGISLTGAVVYFSIVVLMSTGEVEDTRKQQVQQVTILTPPPPPPPPKIEQPPEPEIKEEVKIDEPELEDIPDMPDQPLMGDQLGLDADGTGGADSFGLIGRKGGRSLLDGEPHMIYASQLQKVIEDLMMDNEDIRKKAYSIIAEIWIGNDGSVSRAKLSRSTGDKEIDGILVETLTTMAMMGEAPPADMPQPIKLRISSRM